MKLLGSDRAFVLNDLLTDSAHCWQRFITAIARKIKLVSVYGKPGIWNADGLFADRWSRAVLLRALTVGGIVP